MQASNASENVNFSFTIRLGHAQEGSSPAGESFFPFFASLWELENQERERERASMRTFSFYQILLQE